MGCLLWVFWLWFIVSWRRLGIFFCITGPLWEETTSDGPVMHYGDVTMGDSVSNHQPHDCLLNLLFRHRSKKKALRHWPLCVEFTGDRWIPRTNGQLRGKCFHLMTSSWWSFDNSSGVILNKLLNNHSSSRWFETSWRSCDLAVVQNDTALNYVPITSISLVL